MNIEHFALSLHLILKWIDDVIFYSASKARSIDSFRISAACQAAFEASGRPFDASAAVAKELTAVSTNFSAALGQIGRAALGSQ